MSPLPLQVQAALDDLANHYGNFEMSDRGGNGYLFFAVNMVSQQDVAIKFYIGEAGEQRHDEPRLLAAINSPNILPIFEARNVSEDWAYFITPRCFEGDVDDLIQARPSVHNALDTAIGICRGVSAMHAQRILHRDLKPANIVVDGARPRIADFGSVAAISDGHDDVHASRHSILYRPPESFVSNRYSIKGDVYQVGMITYQLLGGILPYNGEEYLNHTELRQYAAIQDPIDRSIFIDTAIRHRAESGKLLQFNSLPPWISSTAVRALKSMVSTNLANRLSSMAEVAALLTRMRVGLKDWQWVGNNAQLTVADRIIQLRPRDGGIYEAFHRKDNDFRRMPRVQAGTLKEVLRNL